MARQLRVSAGRVHSKVYAQPFLLRMSLGVVPRGSPAPRATREGWASGAAAPDAQPCPTSPRCSRLCPCRAPAGGGPRSRVPRSDEGESSLRALGGLAAADLGLAPGAAHRLADLELLLSVAAPLEAQARAVRPRLQELIAHGVLVDLLAQAGTQKVQGVHDQAGGASARCRRRRGIEQQAVFLQTHARGAKHDRIQERACPCDEVHGAVILEGCWVLRPYQEGLVHVGEAAWEHLCSPGGIPYGKPSDGEHGPSHGRTIGVRDVLIEREVVGQDLGLHLHTQREAQEHGIRLLHAAIGSVARRGRGVDLSWGALGKALVLGVVPALEVRPPRHLVGGGYVDPLGLRLELAVGRARVPELLGGLHGELERHLRDEVGVPAVHHGEGVLVGPHDRLEVPSAILAGALLQAGGVEARRAVDDRKSNIPQPVRVPREIIILSDCERNVAIQVLLEHAPGTQLAIQINSLGACGCRFPGEH
mmetsp:Transcript_22401/g.59702  ORF Transcript_22401/g.59702 Transcript_22401/m.59702 type:complete len:477 (+) Transcript_22401:108-1538(+)